MDRRKKQILMLLWFSVQDHTTLVVPVLRFQWQDTDCLDT